MTRSRAVLAVLALLMAASLMVCPSTAQGQEGQAKRYLSTTTRLDVNPSTESDFNEAAEAVPRRMNFRPARADGEPIGVWIIQQVDFNSR